MIITELDAWRKRPKDLLRTKQFNNVLLGDPTFFRVEQSINPHMVSENGTLNVINSSRAINEWKKLKQAYQSIGIATETLEAAQHLPDSCFTANPSIVIPLPNGDKEVWLGKMAHASREPEVELHEKFFKGKGLSVKKMPANVEKFEGCGDGLVHPKRFCLHAGVGGRTSYESWEAIAKTYTDMDIVIYELVNEYFYHLDTALAPIDEECALFVPDAFNEKGLELLQASFPKAIPLSAAEAFKFAGNAHCPDSKNVLIDSKCDIAIKLLTSRGINVINLDTTEFQKSGGSVFCLKQSF